METSAAVSYVLSVSSGPAFLDTGELQYIAGRCIVRLSVEAQTQDVVYASAGSWTITAIGVSASRRCERRSPPGD